MKKDNLLSAVCLVGILALCFPLVGLDYGDAAL